MKEKHRIGPASAAQVAAGNAADTGRPTGFHEGLLSSSAKVDKVASRDILELGAGEEQLGGLCDVRLRVELPVAGRGVAVHLGQVVTGPYVFVHLQRKGLRRRGARGQRGRVGGRRGSGLGGRHGLGRLGERVKQVSKGASHEKPTSELTVVKVAELVVWLRLDVVSVSELEVSETLVVSERLEEVCVNELEVWERLEVVSDKDCVVVRVSDVVLDVAVAVLVGRVAVRESEAVVAELVLVAERDWDRLVEASAVLEPELVVQVGLMAIL